LKRSILIKEIIDVFGECQLSRKSRERSRENSPNRSPERAEEAKKEDAKVGDDGEDANYPYSALLWSYEELV